MPDCIGEAFVREDWRSFIDENEGLLSKNAKELMDHDLTAHNDYLPLHQRPVDGEIPEHKNNGL